MAKTDKEEEKTVVKSDDRYVYRSQFDMTIVLKGTTKKNIIDARGMVVDTLTVPPVAIKFVGNRFELNPSVANELYRDPDIKSPKDKIDVIVKLIENTRSYGGYFKTRRRGGFWLVISPEFPADDEARAFLDEADKRAQSRQVKVVKHARALDSRA